MALRLRLKELASAGVRYGYRRLHVLLRREGRQVNHKRIYHLYSEEGLSIYTKTPRRRRAARYRVSRAPVAGPNDFWAMDFMSDVIFDRWTLDQWAYLNKVEFEFLKPGKTAEQCLYRIFQRTLQS